nr:site-specific integrase [Marininema mesophilum]
MRVGELCALKWNDIDFQEHTMTISRTYYNPTNNLREYKLLTPKTTTSKRTLDLSPIVIKELTKHQDAQNKIRMRSRDMYHDTYPKFIKTIENRMRRLLKIAKLNDTLTPHSLRHTHTSLLAEAGVSLPEIMARLGHKDDATKTCIPSHDKVNAKRGLP